MLATERPAPFAKTARYRGHIRGADGLTRENADAPYFGAGQPPHILKQAEFRQQRKGARRDELAADLCPGKLAFLDECHRPPCPSQHERSGGARGAAADDDRVVAFGHRNSQHFRATKQWVQSPTLPSSKFQPCRFGHNADSSLSRKPARTLATASCRLTWLQPSSQTRRLARSGSLVRRGSRAIKIGATLAHCVKMSVICGGWK